MKKDWKHLDKWRVISDPAYGSSLGATYGAFQVKFNGVILRIIATDGHDGEKDTGWEHVSCHVIDLTFGKARTPKWDEMCFVKSLFWKDDEVVVQFHVAATDHINIHEHVLHLWRWTKGEFPLPDKAFV